MQNILQQLSIFDAMLIILGVIFLFVSWTINPINGMNAPTLLFVSCFRMVNIINVVCNVFN